MLLVVSLQMKDLFKREGTFSGFRTHHNMTYAVESDLNTDKRNDPNPIQ